MTSPAPSTSHPRVLTLDMGTSSVRALICDEHAAPVPAALARREVHARLDGDGAGELDAAAYIDDLIACVDELAEAGWLDGVTAVSTSAQWHSALPVDAAGEPTGPVLTWLDTRPQPTREPVDAAAFHARTGAWPHTLYWSAKLPWLRRHTRPGPTPSARTPRGGRGGFVGLPDYVRGVLLATTATSSSLASGTGVFDVGACQWDAEALELAEVTEAELPEISDEPATLRPEYARRWPQLADVPWQPVLGDGAASNLGSGAFSADTVAITVGTSAALRVVHPATDAPALPWPVWRYRVDAERLVTGIAFSGGGVLHAWATELLQLHADTEPAEITPGAHGLISLPLHAGTRPPETLPAGSGALVGLSLSTTPQQVLAATLEGAALEVARGLELVERAVGAGRLSVVLGGGGAHASAWWRRVFAATLERPLLLASDPEVGARGAAAHALGMDVPRPDPGIAETVHPDPDDVARMAEVRSRYDALRETDTLLRGNRAAPSMRQV